MAEIEFITTTKGKPSVLFSGHQYRIIRDIHGVVTWLCVNEKKQRYKGSIKTREGKLIASSEKPHVCSSQEAELDVQKKLHICRKRAREDLSIPVCEIFRREFMVCNFSYHIH
ncbi:unnamed protein product [Psylliodes chrysocephalus]|uniref:FLYWCH-type domain-containing protein n=1 Tax=Psylliodes chrysocephalus TaxID=3402493 RepID=A0A9P0D323_9CUCU|nr:unnamed protein product [Psylliodes chrysocephala]